MDANDLGREGPTGVAAQIVRARAGLIVNDWRRSFPAAQGIDPRAVLDVIIEALGRCERASRAAHGHPGLHELFSERADALRTLDAAAIGSLRDAIRRQVLHSLAPAQALVAMHCTSAVLDQLFQSVAAWSSAALERLAYVDDLTGLANRRAANDALHANIARALRHKQELVAVVIDVDHLKMVNDRHGHDAGDAILRSMADAFRTGLRDGDLAFRTGGDEFLVLLPQTSLEDVVGVMARVQAAGSPSFSYGAASTPGESHVADDLLRIADQRLLEWRRATPSVQVTAPRQRAMPGQLPATVAALLAVVAAILTAGEVVNTVWAGIAVAFVGCIAGVMVLGTASRSLLRRRQLADALFLPMVVYALCSFLLHVLASVDQPDATPVQRTSNSLTATSTGRTTVTDVERRQRAASAVPTRPVSESLPRSTAPPAIIEMLTTSTSVAGPVGSTTTEPVPRETTTTTGAPATMSTTTTATTTTTTPTSTTTTTIPVRSAEASGEHGANPPRARDDRVRNSERINDVRVLDNDRAGTGESGEIDPASLSITAGPSHGSVHLRGDGVLQHRANRDLRPDRFRYRVCTMSGACAEAWVIIERPHVDDEDPPSS